VTFLSTMEANFGSLFTGGWSYICDQYKRVMYTWIGAPVEIVTFLLAISMTLTQEIVATSVFLITEILTIENHKLDGNFFDVAFRSQSLLRTTNDPTSSDTN
jgi:hypothetical protein